MHFIVHKEVPEHMAAETGSVAHGRLGVMLQYHCRVTPLSNIGPEAFGPSPKMKSAFVRLLPCDTPPVSVEDESVFSDPVRQACAQRCKTLGGVQDAGEIHAAGIDPGASTETPSPRWQTGGRRASRVLPGKFPGQVDAAVAGTATVVLAVISRIARLWR